MSCEFNPKLIPWKGPAQANGAGKHNIEIPGKAENIRWQTRIAAPTRYENDLADALEKVYGSGAKTAGEIVAGLNKLSCKTQSGLPWTVPLFESEMSILGY